MTKEQHIGATFSQEQSRLTNYIKGRIGSAEDAEDIAQDVFLSFAGGFRRPGRTTSNAHASMHKEEFMKRFAERHPYHHEDLKKEISH